MSRPFEFQPGDAEALAGVIRHARKVAKNHPIYDPQQATDTRYGFNFGAWHCRLTLDSFLPQAKPHWHASVSIMEEVGEEPVVLESGIIASVPQDALLAVQSWDEEHSKQAKFLLGELLAHAILSEDQQVLVADGLFARHALTQVVGG